MNNDISYGPVTCTRRKANAQKNYQFWPVRCLALGVRQQSLLVRRACWTNAVYSLEVLTCALYVYALYSRAQRRTDLIFSFFS